MVFLNLILAGGLAAVSAPIIIHLLHRSKVTHMDWGAMMFLEELVAERAKRIRMHELLLLLVRAGIVACLALALMRPVLNWAMSGARGPSVHTSALILLDDSFSMDAGRPRSAWLEARDQALRYVDTLKKGDDAAVMFTSSAAKGPPPTPLFDLDRVREIIRTAMPHYEKTDMPRAIAAGMQELEARQNPHRELILFSDMQASGWQLDDGTRWSYLSSTIRSTRIAPTIVLASVGDQHRINVAMTDVKPSRAVIDIYSPVSFNFTIANDGPEAVSDVAVTFSVDGAPKSTRTVNLGIEEKQVLAFEHKFESAGSHYVSCHLRCAQDVLPDDDELLYSVVVVDKLPVLIVDGDHREQALSSESAFLKLALSPKDRDDPQWRTVIEPTVIDVSDIRSTDLARYRVIVLANVAALPGSVVSDLERFVVAGGGLMVSLGDKVQRDAYNRDLYRQGGGLLPVPLESSARPISEESSFRLVSAPKSAPLAEAVHLGGIVTDAPSLDLFRPERGQDWTKSTIRNYYYTAPTSGKEDVRTIATFSNGAAALVQKKLGEGKVLLLTTAIDKDWSDLPLHPFYVPLMQNLVLDLASTVIPPRNIAVGQILSHVATGELAHRTYTLTPPKGEPLPLKVQSQGALSVFSFEETEKPGLYMVAPEDGTPDEKVYYVVNADRSESALKRLNSEELNRIERDVGAKYAADWSALARLVGLDGGGIEISPYLIMAAIGLCFVELYLTRRWA